MACGGIKASGMRPKSKKHLRKQHTNRDSEGRVAYLRAKLLKRMASAKGKKLKKLRKKIATLGMS